MPGTFDKLFEKGKAKLKEYSGSSGPSHYGQGGYPGQGYPGQQPQYSQHQYTGAPFPQYGAPPPNQYQQQHPPPPNPQWGPPQHHWGPPPNQWSPAPQQFSPPVPQHSKPQSGQPPPIPGNRPSSFSHPPPHANLKAYWQPSFDSSIPVNHNFRHELGDHGWGNNEKQNYTNSPENSFHHDGRLIVRGLVNTMNGTYTSARLTSHQTLSRPRGFLTATIVPPVAEGIWPAYWMLPADPFTWPTDGEVDIFESWNGDCKNHSCLHWGQYNGEDSQKHRVIDTHLQDMPHVPHTFGFAWMEEPGIPNWRGRLVWYIDGRPVMKASIPVGTRRMEDYRILINVAMGGNVCGGKLPRDGYYDMVITDLKMCEEPPGGFADFERAWGSAPEGKTM